MKNKDKIKNYEKCVGFIRTLRLAFFCEEHQLLKRVDKDCFKCIMWRDVEDFLSSLELGVCDRCKGAGQIFEMYPMEGVGYSGSVSYTFPCPDCVGTIFIKG